MDREKEVEKQFAEYKALGAENKDINLAALMLSALQNQKQNLLSAKIKRWAYLISFGLPPFGLLFALKFYTNKEDDAKTAGHICVVLTIASLLLVWFMTKALLSGSNVDVNQIQQIKPEDIQQLLQ